MGKRKPSHTVAPPPVSAVQWAISGGALAEENGERRTPAPPGRREFLRERDGEQLRRLHVRVPAELERRLKLYCVENEISAGDLIVEALTKLLRSAKILPRDRDAL